MAISPEKFMELTGAEMVCGNLIVGAQATRRIVGTVMDGTFLLNDEGHALMAELDAAQEKPATRRKKSADAADGEGNADEALKA